MPRTNNINTCKLTVTIVVTLYQVLMSGVLAVGGGGGGGLPRGLIEKSKHLSILKTDCL